MCERAIGRVRGAHLDIQLVDLREKLDDAVLRRARLVEHQEAGVAACDVGGNEEVVELVDDLRGRKKRREGRRRRRQSLYQGKGRSSGWACRDD